MDLRQLRYLVALNEHRSFVRAAEAMGITQPAFSRSIQGLEQELGCVLIDRASKDLRPTPEGQVALQHALALIRGASNLTREINQMSKLDAGELHLGCAPALAARLLPDALLAFTQRYPRIQTRVAVDNWEHLNRSLNRSEIEFCIADVRHCQADPGVQTQLLRPRAGLFFCRPAHPLLGKESLSTNDLFEFPLAASRMPSDARKVLANLSGKVDISIHLECEQIPLLVQLVQRSDAIGMATHEAVADELARGTLLELHLRNLPNNLDSLGTRSAIVTRTGFRLSPAAKAMIDLLLQLDRLESAQVA